ncbi:hypothetical protein M0R45_001197 [Rubus argutus]|uniref:RAB6-interacting golgin n=1 Tax=Rubus argutus TaxID=59490 RepID=A0AAW1VNJ9_RUBAR
MYAMFMLSIEGSSLVLAHRVVINKLDDTYNFASIAFFEVLSKGSKWQETRKGRERDLKQKQCDKVEQEEIGNQVGIVTNAENEEPWGKGNNSGRLSIEETEDEEPSRLAISTFQVRVEEIERKKMEVKEKVERQLGRTEEETRHLAQISEELEAMADPMRKELANVRKKIDMANQELKPLGLSCQRKLLTESERLRMQKLEELRKNIEVIELSK